MICYEDKLDTAINSGCPTTFGMERNGYLCLRSEITPKTETDLVVYFVPRLMIPIFQPSENAYKPKSEGERNGYGLTKYQKSIEVFLVANTELTQEQIMWLKDEDWVAVLKQIDGTVIVFGFERGLRLKTSSQDLNSTDFHGGILLTFDENMVNSPMLFGTETLYDWVNDFDIIYGGTIATGGAVKLFVDADKTGYVKLPNGNILTTVAGTINITYTGVGGAITYYVPKNSSISDINTSGLNGSIVYNGSGLFSIYGNLGIVSIKSDLTETIYASECYSLSTIISQKVVTLNASGCALTAKSIGDILYHAYIDNRPNVTYNFSGGTNAEYNDIDTYMTTNLGVNLGLVLTRLQEQLNGDISINGL